MPLPEHILIGPYRYRVIQDADTHYHNEHRRQVALDGTIRWHEQDILLHPDLSADRTATVLLHEVLHGCNELAGLFDVKNEEKIVTGLANTLLDTLRRNPAFVRYLLADDEGASPPT